MALHTPEMFPLIRFRCNIYLSSQVLQCNSTSCPHYSASHLVERFSAKLASSLLQSYVALGSTVLQANPSSSTPFSQFPGFRLYDLPFSWISPINARISLVAPRNSQSMPPLLLRRSHFTNGRYVK